jgi:hypothetical protein
VIHAGETYTAIALDGLSLSLSRAQVALGDRDRRETIRALRALRGEIADVLVLLEPD